MPGPMRLASDDRGTTRMLFLRGEPVPRLHLDPAKGDRRLSNQGQGLVTKRMGLCEEMLRQALALASGR